MFDNVPLFSVKSIFGIKFMALTFANSANNREIISTFNVQNSNISKVHRHH